MQIAKNKTAAITIGMFLTLSMAASMMLVPCVSAHTPAWNIRTYAYVFAAPNPVGVGQKASIDMWISVAIPSGEFGNNIRWHNYTLTITAPNGDKTTQTWPVVYDPTSNQDYYFTPSQTGNYIIDFTFPGQTYNWTGPYANDVYMASSASTTLTVQQEQIPEIPATPLPTAYWTRPIFGENSNWWTVSSNWLGTGAPGYSTGMLGGSFPGDAVGSQTSHVMWTKPLQSGGVVGGNNFQIQGDTYFEGTAYATRYTNPIIIDGMLYYTEPVSFAGASSGNTVCVNLRTGQQIWSSFTMPAPSFGYIYDVQDPNEHGVYPPILVATIGGGFFAAAGPVTWECFDADTGRLLFNVTKVPGGTKVMGPEGEYLVISIVNYGTTAKPNYYLQEWNSSRLWDNLYSGPSTTPSVVPPITNGADPSLLDWNVSLSSLNTLSATPSIESAFYNDMLIGEAGSFPAAGNSLFYTPSWSPYTYFGVNLNATSGAIGTVLWTNTVSAPSGNLTVSYDGADPTAGTFIEYYTETMQFVGYSMSTGKQIWGPTASQATLNFFSTGYGGQGPTLAYGKLYVGGYSGIVYCYDLTNGTLLWTYGNGGAGNSTNGGLQVPRNYPTIVSAIANGIVYTVTSEHTFETPIYKGALTRAINATTGQEIWTLLAATGSSTAYAMADGYNTFDNGYDNQIYVVGKGPSATTVQAPMTAITVGDNAIIQGTVMDISAGTKQDQQAADFPNGVPVASDASMSAWMGYVYQQQPHPTDFTGVSVSIDAIDPNNNFIHIGTATTDIDGKFSYMWKTPDVPGKYTIIATFAGTKAYYASYDETAAAVSEAPVATPPPAYPVPVDYTMAIIGMGIVIVIVVVIVGILILRKK
jgi:outer membrane protein assembly factor BamB